MIARPEDITEQMYQFDTSVPTEEFFPGPHVFESLNGRPLNFSQSPASSSPEDPNLPYLEDPTLENDNFLPTGQEFNWLIDRSWLVKRLDRTRGKLAVRGFLLAMDNRATFQEIFSDTFDQETPVRPLQQQYEVSDVELAPNNQEAYRALHAVRKFDAGNFGQLIRPIRPVETFRALQKHSLTTIKGIGELLTTSAIIVGDTLGLVVINPLYVSFQAAKRCVEARTALLKVIDKDPSLSTELRMHQLVRRYIRSRSKPA